ncbi:MAG TPA: hypothetical protein PLR99_06560 [Polyangiaceae bacterium]|nr:hypothetical protein [Polyangiaceae bacterium]
MYRQPPTPSEEINLYVRTYYSLLRSTGEVRIRALEEAHAFSRSALHLDALSAKVDLSAFGYAAGRLPSCFPRVRQIVLGQSHELFEAAGFDVRTWQIVKTRGRRRPIRWDEGSRLAVFIASVSDIDDLVPILVAYQIEWNKLHNALRGYQGREAELVGSPELLASELSLEVADVERLVDAFGKDQYADGLAEVIARPLDLRAQMLASSYSQYQRAAQRWWGGIEPSYLEKSESRRAPVYFVSSNTHAVANLLGGYAQSHRREMIEWAIRADPEGLGADVAKAAESGREEEIAPLLYYLLRAFIHAGSDDSKMNEVRRFESTKGLLHLSGPGRIDVDAQILRLSDLDPTAIDPRLRVPGIERLAQSEAVLINIDYPLGMAAYHLLSRVGQGVGEVRGIYIMGKAATLNGRVGDVLLSNTVYDEHSGNTFLFRNALTADAVAPLLRFGSVFDNQSAVTVRSAFLQNKDYMATFYREGYTVLEMEAGPFLGAVHELSNPRRLPSNEIVNLTPDVPFDVGLLHYASDTPYSRRQSLLSKSLSFFGVDSTYACAIAIARRIFTQELARLDDRRPSRWPGP